MYKYLFIMLIISLCIGQAEWIYYNDYPRVFRTKPDGSETELFMDKNSNIYTFLFVGVMVIGIASILAFTSQTLKPMQKENVKNEKMQNILSTIGINVSREEAEGLYSIYIKEELALKIDGSVNESLNPFSEISLAKELKKDYKNQHFPF